MLTCAELTSLQHFKDYEGFDMYWETQALDLLQNDDGDVIGVRVKDNDGKCHRIHGKKVMLACGGFEGEKRPRFCIRRPLTLPQATRKCWPDTSVHARRNWS